MEVDHKKKEYNTRLLDFLQSKKEPLQIATLTLLNAILSSTDNEGTNEISIYFFLFINSFFFLVLETAFSFINSLEICEFLKSANFKGEAIEKLTKNCINNIEKKKESLSKKTSRVREHKLQPTNELFQYADFKLKKNQGIYSHFRTILQDLSSLSSESEEIWKACSDAVYQLSLINPKVDDVNQSLKSIFHNASNPNNRMKHTQIKKKKIVEVGETNTLLTNISDLERANSLLLEKLKEYDPSASVEKYTVASKNSRKSMMMFQKDPKNQETLKENPRKTKLMSFLHDDIPEEEIPTNIQETPKEETLTQETPKEKTHDNFSSPIENNPPSTTTPKEESVPSPNKVEYSTPPNEEKVETSNIPQPPPMLEGNIPPPPPPMMGSSSNSKFPQKKAIVPNVKLRSLPWKVNSFFKKSS